MQKIESAVWLRQFTGELQDRGPILLEFDRTQDFLELCAHAI